MANTIETIPFDETFDREYELEVLRDMPSSPSILRYGSGGGPIVRVTPHGAKPFVVVVPGTLETARLSTWPHPRRFAAFDGTAAPTLLDIDAPNRPIPLDGGYGHALQGVMRFPRHGIVVIATCCTLVAYDRDGTAWDRSGIFCCDDPLLDRTEDALIVIAESHTEPRRRYVLDPRTGEETILRG